MMTYWLLTRTGNDAETPSNIEAATASETSREEPGELQQYINNSSGKFSMFGLSGVQPSLATQLGHNSDKLERSRDNSGESADVKHGLDCSSRRAALALNIELDEEGNENEANPSSQCDDDDDDKKEAENDCNKDEKVDETEVDDLPILKKLKNLAKKAKDEADGNSGEGDDRLDNEMKESGDNGDEEDGDNDVFGSETGKKTDACEKKRNDSLASEKVEFKNSEFEN
ncbi:guanylate cyclase 32e [Plakobranchus ocellatus]|uniref:Guanylate cyclase 32e n=1 Tax=Plakobranchus ocellatus TaxID=259542 RepID=A0AAV4AKL2_9GAST|nr:guanylate cyclase 32e [Plakobranchus ocellatus]